MSTILVSRGMNKIIKIIDDGAKYCIGSWREYKEELPECDSKYWIVRGNKNRWGAGNNIRVIEKMTALEKRRYFPEEIAKLQQRQIYKIDEQARRAKDKNNIRYAKAISRINRELSINNILAINY